MKRGSEREREKKKLSTFYGNKFQTFGFNFKPKIQIRAKLWDRIKGLKLRSIDTYCGGAAVHEAPQITAVNKQQ